MCHNTNTNFLANTTMTGSFIFLNKTTNVSFSDASSLLMFLVSWVLALFTSSLNKVFPRTSLALPSGDRVRGLGSTGPLVT